MKFFGSAIMAIVALAVFIGITGGGGTAEAAKLTMRGVALGSEENPPVVNGGSAYVTFVFDDVTNDLSYAVTVSGLSADLVTASHIHRGAKGVNGPVIHNLSLVGFTQISGVLHFAPADVADLRAGNYYFNVHSKDNPGGFARMQLVLPSVPAAAATSPVTPPRTGDAGLAAGATSLLPLLGLVAFAAGGMGVFAVARKQS
jgi:hypothetical protein